MFTTEFRTVLLGDLVEWAQADPAIIAAAIIGSGAAGTTDEWSDIDLALRLEPGLDPIVVAGVWTERLTQAVGVADHLDVHAAGAIYRVFLLDNSLQVDLSFWPADRFAATSSSFHLLFGEATESRPTVSPLAGEVLGLAWLYALHVRSAIARQRPWQALHYLNVCRDHIVTLACLRSGLPTREGRGVDQLSEETRAAFARTIAATLDMVEQSGALAAAVDLILSEAAIVDPDLAGRIAVPLRILAPSVPGTAAP